MSISRREKKVSRGRRWSRVLIWSAFVVVVTLRILFPPEIDFRFGRAARERDRAARNRRPPTRVHPPVSRVPADLWRIQIDLAPKAVDLLRSYYWDRRNGRGPDRPEVTATVREGTTVYRDVTLHLKGAAGSFRAFDDKPAFTLNFSRNRPGQQFHGYSKISLNNSVQDPSYLTEIICRELFEAAGVPVPRADHATVLVNGRDLGLYVLTEGFGKPFLKRYFKDVRGNLYDGGFVQEITAHLETNSGEKPEDRSDVRRLLDAAAEDDATRRWQRLSQVLDLDRFLSFLAMEIMTCHWDGYGLNRNNYRLFHDLETDRMVFMPHGLDQMFGVRRSSPNSPIQPTMQGLIARAVTTTPEGRRLYLERIATLRTNVFIEEKLIDRVQQLARRIRPTLAAYAPELAQEHDVHVDNLCRRISERARSISAQLASSGKPIYFDAGGATRLSDWTPRITTQPQGLVRFEKIERDGKQLLEVAASQGGGSGSWRTRALLKPGSYRFEGNVWTRGIKNTGGVCLRISGTRVERLTTSDDDWSALRFSFSVKEPRSEVELICELRAPQGLAWFEQDSLRLVRE
jgi:spore coat protein H